MGGPGLVDSVEVLRRSVLGAHLTEPQLEAVAALGERAAYTAGEQVTTLNESVHDLFVIKQGRVQFLTHDGDLLGEAGPGELVGEIAFMDGRPRTSHSVAVGFVETIRFPAAPLRRLMVQDKEIGFKILANLTQVLTRRMRAAIGQMDALMDIRDDIWAE